ncbi:MAG: hypothetical protein H6721_23285 [Sandaracinus sp.]|nr:hypothetical protein [Sandaracinus sp.]
MALLRETTGWREVGAAPRVVIASGLIAWAVVLLVPLAVARPRPTAWPVLVAVLVPLVAALPTWRREIVRRLLLLVIYPCALATGVALSPRLADLDAHPPTMRLLGALAFLAFAASASVADPRPAPPGLAIKSLSAVSGDPGLSRRARVRAWLVGAVTVGALAIAVVAPAVGEDPSVTFGAASGPAAGTLVAVLAALLGTVVVAGFVGPATRRRRGVVTARRAQRVGLYLLVVLVGGLVLRTLAARG